MKTYNDFMNENTPRIKNGVFSRELNKVKSKVVSRDLSPQKFTDIIAGVLDNWSIEVDKFVDPNVDSGTVNVDAGFVEPDDESESGVDLNVVFSPEDKTIQLDAKSWKVFVNLVSDALVHEFLHSAQKSSRGSKSQRELTGKELKGVNSNDSDFSYYGNQDEMEAFAVNAASELKRKFGSKKRVMKKLSNYSKITLKDSPSFDSYLEHFKKDSILMKKFVKMVIKYL